MKKYWFLMSFLFLASGVGMARADAPALPEDLVSADELSTQLPADMNEGQAVDDLLRPRRHYRCYAVNGRGMVFEAVARYPEYAQRMAMDRCYTFPSRYCYERGCHRI